jgi:hypothetical protein
MGMMPATKPTKPITTATQKVTYLGALRFI